MYLSMGSSDLLKLLARTQLKSSSVMGTRQATPSSSSSIIWRGTAVRITRDRKWRRASVSGSPELQQASRKGFTRTIQQERIYNDPYIQQKTIYKDHPAGKDLQGPLYPTENNLQGPLDPNNLQDPGPTSSRKQFTRRPTPVSVGQVDSLIDLGL